MARVFTVHIFLCVFKLSKTRMKAYSVIYQTEKLSENACLKLFFSLFILITESYANVGFDSNKLSMRRNGINNNAI